MRRYCGTRAFHHLKAVVSCEITSKKRNYGFCTGDIIIVCGRSVHQKLKLKQHMFARLFSILFEGMRFKLNAKTFKVLKLKQNTLQPLFIKREISFSFIYLFWISYHGFSLAFCFRDQYLCFSCYRCFRWKISPKTRPVRFIKCFRVKEEMFWI